MSLAHIGTIARLELNRFLQVLCERVGRAEEAIRYVAPVGEKDEYVTRAMAAVTPFLSRAETLAA